MQNIDALSDATLCRWVAEGRSEAEEILVIRYNRLVRICARPFFLVGGDSEDLIQEGMVGLLKAIRSYDEGKDASFRTFAEVCIRSRLYSILRNQNLNKHAALNHSVLVELPFFDSNSFTVGPLDISRSNPEDLLILQENFDEMWKRVRKQLSELEAKILGLYLDGLSYQEIAVKVSKSPKSVDNAVQRIRRKVARHDRQPPALSGSG
jgi:RNA polymerase sporulation-specific sigma factor